MSDKPVFITGTPEPELVYARKGEVEGLRADNERLRAENKRLVTALSETAINHGRQLFEKLDEIKRLRAFVKYVSDQIDNENADLDDLIVLANRLLSAKSVESEQGEKG